MGTVYHVATVGKNSTFEAATMQILRAKIVDYYADDADEDASAPEVTSIVIHADELEVEISPKLLAEFNKNVEADFAEKLEELAQPSDYDEHNTLWKGGAL